MSGQDEIIWVAVYERVSSDEQREKESIKTQTDAIDAYLATHANMRVYKRYLDDGVSGTKPLGDRPAGAKLLQDARDRRFTKVLVTRPNRVGRRAVHILNAVELLTSYGIEVIGVVDAMDDPFILGIKAVVAEEERRAFLEHTAMGIARAAKDGRYLGGIVAIGYKADGKKPDVRLAVSDSPFFSDWTESEFVRRIFAWLVEGWTAVRIADHLNALGVPTVYQKDARLVRRGERKQRTDWLWRPGRILSIVKNPVYKGEYHFGRRSKKGREPIVAQVPALVTVEVWDAAQATLSRNRIIPKNSDRRYMLRSIMRCSLCGLTYTATWSKGELWYRCGGGLKYRSAQPCKSLYLRGSRLESLIWADVEAFFRNADDLLEELRSEQHDTSVAALREAEREIALQGLAGIPPQRNRVLDFLRRGKMTPDECERRMDEIIAEEEAYRAKLAELTPDDTQSDDEPGVELVDALRHRIADADEALRQEVVSILVRQITIKTEFVDGRKRGTIVVEYRFPGVVDTDTGTRDGKNYTKLQRVVQL